MIMLVTEECSCLLSKFVGLLNVVYLFGKDEFEMFSDKCCLCLEISLKGSQFCKFYLNIGCLSHLFAI
jgi:hypothetical protein